MNSPSVEPVADIRLKLNGEVQSLVGPINIAQLLALRGLAGKRVAVERNGEIVPRGMHERTPLADGDRLEIVVAVGGG